MVLTRRRDKFHIPCFPASGKASSFHCRSFQNQSVCFDFVRKNGGAETEPSRLSAAASWSKPILTTCRRKIDWIVFAASEPRTLRGIIDKLRDCSACGNPFFTPSLWILHNSTIISRPVQFCTAVPLTGTLFPESFGREVIVSVFTIRKVFKNVQFLYITPY